MLSQQVPDFYDCMNPPGMASYSCTHRYVVAFVKTNHKPEIIRLCVHTTTVLSTAVNVCKYFRYMYRRVRLISMKSHGMIYGFILNTRDTSQLAF